MALFHVLTYYMTPCLHITWIWIWLHVHIFVTLNLLSLTSRHRSGYGSMFAYYHSHGAILHSVINMDLDMAPCSHIITHMDLAPCSHIITHMEPYYTL